MMDSRNHTYSTPTNSSDTSQSQEIIKTKQRISLEMNEENNDYVRRHSARPM